MAPLIPSDIPAFKVKYNIPDDVEVRVAGKDEPLIGTRERIPIPTRAITEGGIRFPLDPLLIWVLSAAKLCPLQCCLNFFRIVMGVSSLNKLLGLSLGLWEILYCYIIKAAGDSYYVSVRKNERYLVTHLPDLNKGHENDVVFVSGNWEYAPGTTPSYRCPYEEGIPGEIVKGMIVESSVKMDQLQRVWDFNESLFCRAAHTLLGYTPTYTSFIAVPNRPNATQAADREAIHAARSQTPRPKKKSSVTTSGRRPVKNFLNFLSTVDPVLPSEPIPSSSVILITILDEPPSVPNSPYR